MAVCDGSCDSSCTSGTAAPAHAGQHQHMPAHHINTLHPALHSTPPTHLHIKLLSDILVGKAAQLLAREARQKVLVPLRVLHPHPRQLPLGEQLGRHRGAVHRVCSAAPRADERRPAVAAPHASCSMRTRRACARSHSSPIKAGWMSAGSGSAASSCSPSGVGGESAAPAAAGSAAAAAVSGCSAGLSPLPPAASEYARCQRALLLALESAAAGARRKLSKPEPPPQAAAASRCRADMMTVDTRPRPGSAPGSSASGLHGQS